MRSSRYPILYVDDERENLVTFRYAVEEHFEVLTANSGAEALELLTRQPVSVLITDQRMPGMTGVELCAAVRELRPEVVRVIVTAYSDLNAAVAAINRGQVARYLAKPWHNEELLEVLDASVELARLQRTVREMQSRLLRRGESTAIGSVRDEIARQLRVPISTLSINAEQVRDLLDAGLSSWPDRERSEELVTDARRAHVEMDVPLAELERILGQLSRRERLHAPEAPPLCDVARVVRATAGILAPNVGRLAPEVTLLAAPVVAMDPADLAQVVAALLTNAVQALGESGEAPHVTVEQRGDRALLSVSDRGHGIADQDLARIFDPYFTTREGARGLGLSLAQELVRGAGGDITVRSDAGIGTRIEVSLPVYAATPVPLPP